MKKDSKLTPVSRITSAFRHNRNTTYDASAQLEVPVKLVGAEKDFPRLTYLVNRLAKSKIGKELLEIGAKAGYTLSFATVRGAVGECTKDGAFITLGPNFSDSKLISTLAHEFRHAGQFARGGNEDFGVDNIKSEIIKTRSMEADAQASAIMACYELHQQGDISPYLDFKRNYPEITSAFEKALKEENAFENGKAQTAAFKGWYDDNYTKKAYEDGYQVNFMQKFMREGLVGKKPYSNDISSKDMIEQVCWSSNDNGNYFRGNKNILETGKYLDVDSWNKSFFKKYFANREQKYGIPKDPTVDMLPERFLSERELMQNFYQTVLKGSRIQGAKKKAANPKMAKEVREKAIVKKMKDYLL